MGHNEQEVANKERLQLDKIICLWQFTFDRWVWFSPWGYCLEDEID